VPSLFDCRSLADLYYTIRFRIVTLRFMLMRRRLHAAIATAPEDAP